jgi:predicted metal-dependent hydrolase
MSRHVRGGGSSAGLPAVADLPEGPVSYLLRTSHQARRLRVTLDPVRGVIVTVPAGNGRAIGDPEQAAAHFLAEREHWLRRHLAHQERDRRRLAERGPLGDGAQVRFRGELHRLRVVASPNGARWTRVRRVGGDVQDELVVEVARVDGRTLATVLRTYARERARRAIDAALLVHAEPLGVEPGGIAIRDPRSRWGSASRTGRLGFSWRLILAPPQALDTVVVHELAHLRVFGHGPRFWDLVASRAPDHARWRRWLRDHSYELHAAFAEDASD